MKKYFKEADIYRIKGTGHVVIWNNSTTNREPSWWATPLKFYCEVTLKYENAIVREADTKQEVFELLVE